MDENGEATHDPNKVVALSPFGDSKGYGLAMVVEIFSAMLTGAAFACMSLKCMENMIKIEN